MQARDSGDPAAIGQASRRVIALALVEMAKLRLDEKAYGEAVKFCRDSLEFEDTADTRVEIAIVSLYAKRPLDAIKEATRAAEMDPLNALAWTIKGEGLLRNGDYAGAAEALKRAFEVKPDPESVYSLGMAQLGMGEKEAAAKSFSQFLDLVDDSGWSRVVVGRAYQEQALQEEAEREFQNALRLDPKAPNAHYFWAITLLQGNAWSPTAEAYSHLQAELQLNPRHFEANYMMGSLASTARDYSESDRYLHLAAEIKPSVPETWVLLGLNAQSRRDNQRAEAFFRKAISLTKNLDPKEHFEIRKAYFGLGRLLRASGRTKEAEEFLAKAQELQMKSLTEGRKRTTARDEEGEKDNGAAAPYIPESDLGRPSLSPPRIRASAAKNDPSSGPRAANRSPFDPEAKTERHLAVVLGASFNDLATSEALQEKYQEAFHHYHDAERWDPKIPGLQRNLGLAAYFADQPAETIRVLSRVVAETPADERARAVLGLAYFAKGEFSRTAQTLDPIANRAIQDPQLGFAWAKSLAKTGNKRAAARALQSIEKTDANLSVESLIHFAQLWQELGESGRAEQTFRHVLAIDTENAEAKCALHISKCP